MLNIHIHEILLKTCFSVSRNIINIGICRSVNSGHAPWPFKSSLGRRTERGRILKSAEYESGMEEQRTSTQALLALHTIVTPPYSREHTGDVPGSLGVLCVQGAGLSSPLLQRGNSNQWWGKCHSSL